MFNPIYTISDKLLNNIKRINIIIAGLNNKSFSNTILANFEKKASSLSTFASTSIEGNPLPLTEVKRILRSKPENVRNTELEVLNYNSVLEELNKQITVKKIIISQDLICNIQRQVTSGLIDKFRCGAFRSEPVFVNDPRTGQPTYLPPDHQDVNRLMNELIEFVTARRGSLDPLILAGIFHKQFVIVHPFIDGNGRTARLATKVLLADMGLNTFNLFSFENYYNNNVTAYFKNVGVLGNYYEIFANIDFTGWLEYFTDGIIDELLRVEKELGSEPGTPETELLEHHKRILSFIEKKGFITDKEYSKLTNRAKATRTLDFMKLLKMGMIEKSGKGRATHYKLKKKGYL